MRGDQLPRVTTVTIVNRYLELTHPVRQTDTYELSIISSPYRLRFAVWWLLFLRHQARILRVFREPGIDPGTEQATRESWCREGPLLVRIPSMRTLPAIMWN
jgi:hypothetical protein